MKKLSEIIVEREWYAELEAKRRKEAQGFPKIAMELVCEEKQMVIEAIPKLIANATLKICEIDQMWQRVSDAIADADDGAKLMYREIFYRIYEGKLLPELFRRCSRLAHLYLVLTGERRETTLWQEKYRFATEDADIITVVSASMGLDPRVCNRNIPCPFHDDKHPSFTLYPDSNRYYCHGCGASGSVIDFVMHYHNVTFKQAVEIIWSLR